MDALVGFGNRGLLLSCRSLGMGIAQVSSFPQRVKIPI